MLLRLGLLALVGALGVVSSAQAQPPERVIAFTFKPTARAQVALWVETPEGAFVETVGLTQAVAYRGIGNRPGATLMNSGFRWPYGRREGVLPYWAHQRASAPDAAMFPRVIFQNRLSEGYASRTSRDASTDQYYCLSFDVATTGRDALDAVSCASVFMSDKGRYMTGGDVQNGYAEPWEDPAGTGAVGRMMPLSLRSFYPPRRDVVPCSGGACDEHPDVAQFASDARAVMPNIDAVTMATPAEDSITTVTFDVPAAWENGDYVAYLEINVEGDYNATYNDTTYRSPSEPAAQWDHWAKTYGYAYRGQPSVVYRVPFSLGSAGTWESEAPAGYGSLHGESGTLNPMGSPSVIADDPAGAPGSGADRLKAMASGARLRVIARAQNLCGLPEPPPECSQGCDGDADCSSGFLCGPARTCVGECDLPTTTAKPLDVRATPYPDEKHTHEWSLLAFEMPESSQGIQAFEVRVSTLPITDEASFIEATPAVAASIDTVALQVPTDQPAGNTVEVALGGLQPQTRYHVGMRARDRCGRKSGLVTATLETTEINFSTVTPCFIATAAYGTPYAEDIDVLRSFRDAYLMTHAPGRWAVGVYYAVGPYAADVIRESELLRALVRMQLYPAVKVAGWLVGE